MRKQFFFEKKNQKTFISAVADSTDKSFLLLFSKKKALLSVWAVIWLPIQPLLPMLKHRALGRDADDIKAVEIRIRPVLHLRGAVAVVGQEAAHGGGDLVMFPGDDSKFSVRGIFQGLREGRAVGVADVDVDGEAEGDSGGFECGERPDVVVGDAVIGFGDCGIGGEHRVGNAELFLEHGGECQGAVEALAIELAEAGLGFFRVAEEHDGLR